MSYQPPKQMAGRFGSKRTHWHAGEKGRKAEMRINESPLLWTVTKETLQSIVYTWASTWQSTPAFDFSQAQFKVWILIRKPRWLLPGYLVTSLCVPLWQLRSIRMLTILQYNHWKGVLDQLSLVPFLIGLDRVRKESQSQGYLVQSSA